MPSAADDAKGDKTLPVVILLGDSIRIQYQGIVRAKLKGKATVWSPKENCAHTAFTLGHLETWVKGRNAAVVHINVGLHDLFLLENTNQPRHSLEVYTENLRAIFRKLKELTDADLIFALTTAVDEKRQAASKGYKRVVRRNPDIAAYNEKAAEIAREFGAHVNDLYGCVQAGGIETLISDDGVHLSPAGAQTVGQQVTQSILAVLEKRGKR